MSDHNYDEDHWLAPTNPRTAFALHHAAALGDVDEVMRLLAGCDRAHIRNCNQTAKGVDPVRAHPLRRDGSWPCRPFLRSSRTVVSCSERPASLFL